VVPPRQGVDDLRRDANSDESEAVLLELDGPLARITLNRPAVLNAMDLAWVPVCKPLAERPEHPVRATIRRIVSV
jgi:enoyl-CoA hydratase/carnithine racemase